MGFLSGKRVLIFGVASNRSIAWGIAQAMHREGADLAFAYMGERLRERVEKLAGECDSDIVVPCDVEKDDEIEAVFEHLDDYWDTLDIIVHSVGFAPREQLAGGFVESITRDGFAISHDISAYSLAALAKAGPDQDVTFQSGGRHGMFGSYSRLSYTTGRMFVHEGRMHLIIGVIQEFPDIDNTVIDDIFYPIGTRIQRVEKGWELQPAAGRLEQQRGDWLSFVLDSEPASSTQAFTSRPPEPSQSDEASAPRSESEGAAQRLQVIEDLKLKGLITDQEYRDKRQQILDDL